VTNAEICVLRAQLSADRARIAGVAAQLAALREIIGENTPTVVELTNAAGSLHRLYHGLEQCLSGVADATGGESSEAVG
jgi:hypothetical protein